MSDYEEFAVRFMAGNGSTRLAASTSEGEASAELVLPPSIEKAALRLVEPNSELRDERSSRDFQVSRQPLETGIDDVGNALFAALFPTPIRSLLDRACGGGRSVRIRLRFDFGDAAATKASQLPWEVIRRDGAFLALDPRYAIVRAVDAPQPVTAPDIERPLRILVAGASPRSYEPLKILSEESEIDRTWNRPGVTLRTLRDANRRSLRKSVDEDVVHLLHFMGHGRYDSNTERGSLILDNGTGGSDEVYGEQVASLLRRPSLRLVVLNACNSGRSAQSQARAFAGVASAMSWAGIVAVVAMQRPISDRSAVLFGSVLHERLAAGEPLEAAVQRGRVALYAEPFESADWHSPVVFLRAPTGDIFRFPGRASSERSSAATATASVGRDLRAKRVTIAGVARSGSAPAAEGGHAVLDVSQDLEADEVIVAARLEEGS